MYNFELARLSQLNMRIQQGGGEEILLWKGMKINVNNNYFENSVKKYTLRNQTIFMHQVSFISVGHIFIQNGEKTRMLKWHSKDS